MVSCKTMVAVLLFHIMYYSESEYHKLSDYWRNLHRAQNTEDVHKKTAQSV